MDCALTARASQKIDDLTDCESRWRFNRRFIYFGALKVIGLTIHPINGKDGSVPRTWLSLLHVSQAHARGRAPTSGTRCSAP